MNKWKIAFLTLVGLLVIGAVALIVMLFSGGENTAKPTAKTHEGNNITITTTPKDFESLANTFIRDATNGSAVQAQLEIDKNVKIKSNVEALGATVPVTIDFDPEVDASGNLLLHQKNVTVGMLDLPTETVLKLVRDSGKLPSWITLQPSEETAYIDLSALDISMGASLQNAHIQAKDFDLNKGEIVLNLIIPQK